MNQPDRSDVTVRDAVPADAARIAELLAGGALTIHEEPTGPEPYERAIEEIGRTPGAAVLVAEAAGAVVGVCQLNFIRHLQHNGGRCAEVESVHVDGSQRSGGIGSVLMAEVVRRAREAGCYRVQLTSNLARTDAHRFYDRLGFEHTHAGFKLYL